MSAPLLPDDPVTRLSGVGPKRAEHLARLGLHTLHDLLRTAPRAYEERGTRIAACDVAARRGGYAVVRGRIVRSFVARGRGRRPFLRVRLEDDSGTAEALWFNAAFLARDLRTGTCVALSGRVSADGVLLQPEIAKLEAATGEPPARLMGCRPLYSVTDGVSQRLVHSLVTAALPAADALADPLSAEVREMAGVEELSAAMRLAHRPRDRAEAERGRERLLFDALLAIENAVRRRLRRRLSRPAPRSRGTGGGAARFVERLPFRLTPSQEEAVAAATDDLNGIHPMGRILVGEVGSGKTAVALAVIEEARSRGLACALLAPTDLLARQHFATAGTLLPRGHERAVLLTGSLNAADAREARRRLASGEADLAIGTHALLAERTSWPKLGLCVIDEQQRFGVRQRRALLAKGRTPHTLVLTATPIPRTLARLALGDVDVSTLQLRANATGDVETRVLDAGQRGAAWKEIRRHMDLGAQAFFVRPRIGGKDGAGGVLELHGELARGPLAHTRVGLIHGKQPARERDEIVEAFRTGQLAALVATTVVEVGLDVPGATILWVEEAERLGLAQLHQLRGRIARRGQKGYCWLVPSPDAAEASKERLAALVQVRDGFALAEIDLATRGPGELLGVRQSGRLGVLAGFASPERLVALIEKARRVADWFGEQQSWSDARPPVPSRSC